MKDKSEIEKMFSDMKDAVVDANGEALLQLQGYLKGLRWVLSDEKEEEE